MELPYLQRGNIVYLLYVQVCNNKKKFYTDRIWIIVFLLVESQFKHNVKLVFNIFRPDLHLKFYIFFSFIHFIFFFREVWIRFKLTSTYECAWLRSFYFMQSKVQSYTCISFLLYFYFKSALSVTVMS